MLSLQIISVDVFVDFSEIVVEITFSGVMKVLIGEVEIILLGKDVEIEVVLILSLVDSDLMNNEVVSALIFNEVVLIIILDKEGNVEKKLVDIIELYFISEDLIFDSKIVVFEIVLYIVVSIFEVCKVVDFF